MVKAEDLRSSGRYSPRGSDPHFMHWFTLSKQQNLWCKGNTGDFDSPTPGSIPGRFTCSCSSVG